MLYLIFAWFTLDRTDRLLKMALNLHSAQPELAEDMRICNIFLKSDNQLIFWYLAEDILRNLQLLGKTSQINDCQESLLGKFSEHLGVFTANIFRSILLV